ncbi:DUF6795 domain-containing protein [Vibrio harveyi]|uniref:DUF6795 domain-containing protein n=1 Tax=Vibrio harveyi TaxID=669 RepID=UPI0040693BAA
MYEIGNRMVKILVFLMSATILLLSTGCNADMFNFFKSKKFQYTLSSEITGSLYLDGKAFTSKVVYLHTAFSNNRYITETMTSEKGYFHFEPTYHYQTFKEPTLHESSSYIGIYIFIDGIKHYLLEARFSDVKPYEFISDNLLDLSCEINSDEYHYFFKNRFVENGLDLEIISRCDLKGFSEKILLNKDT